MRLTQVAIAFVLIIAAAGSVVAAPSRTASSVGGPAKQTGTVSGKTIPRHH